MSSERTANDPAPEGPETFIAWGALVGLAITLGLQVEYDGLDEPWAWLPGPLMAVVGGFAGFTLAATRRRARTPPAPTPTSALILVGLLAVAFVAQVALGLRDDFIERHLHLVQLGGLVPTLVRDGEVWRIATAPWLHGGTVHAALNLTAVLLFGRALARRAGPTVMFGAFLLPALLSGALIAALLPGGLALLSTAGAAGLFGAALLAERFARQAGAAPTTGWLWWGGAGCTLIGAALTPHAHGGAQVLAAALGAGLIVLERRRRPLAGQLSRPYLATRLAVGAAGLATLAALAVAGAGATARRARASEAFPSLTKQMKDTSALNAAAWDIATDREASAEKIDIGFSLSERSVQLDPESSAFLDTLATLHYRRGRYAEAARREFEAAARGRGTFFWAQLQRFLRAYRAEAGALLEEGGISAGSIHLERVGWGIVLWWRRGTAPTVVAEVRSADEEILGTVLLVATGTAAGSHRFSIPHDLAEHLDEGAQVSLTWVRPPHPDWDPGLSYFGYDPKPDTLP